MQHTSRLGQKSPSHRPKGAPVGAVSLKWHVKEGATYMHARTQCTYIRRHTIHTSKRKQFNTNDSFRSLNSGIRNGFGNWVAVRWHFRDNVGARLVDCSRWEKKNMHERNKGNWKVSNNATTMGPWGVVIVVVGVVVTVGSDTRNFKYDNNYYNEHSSMYLSFPFAGPTKTEFQWVWCQVSDRCPASFCLCITKKK